MYLITKIKLNIYTKDESIVVVRVVPDIFVYVRKIKQLSEWISIMHEKENWNNHKIKPTKNYNKMTKCFLVRMWNFRVVFSILLLLLLLFGYGVLYTKQFFNKT